MLGVSVLLLGGVLSMGPYALDLEWSALAGLERAALIAFVSAMAVGKGWFGFHRGFSRRLVARVLDLHREPRLLRVLLAPLFGMSLIHAPVRHLLRGWGLMLAIASVVPLVRTLPSPWRGIVDAGVVAGLAVGLISLWWQVAELAFSRSTAPPATAAAPAPRAPRS